ncbi:Crp/Fnr family transcriptional regulator [Brevundimonas vesicularis]|uniref:Crp/Fnr family transcriptional regulator n=1 Tax=Brevundimonas vesicularis TaxID=41276 RepID=UPI0038D4722E
MAVSSDPEADLGLVPHGTSALLDHPVFEVMPSAVRSALSATARWHALEADEALPERSLYFLVRGTIGLFGKASQACIGVVGPGTVLGWEKAVKSQADQTARALMDCQGYAAPVQAVQDLLGTAWSRRFLAAHTASRARILGCEAACQQQHAPAERLAKWILLLARTGGYQEGRALDKGRFALLLHLSGEEMDRACGVLIEHQALRRAPGGHCVPDLERLAGVSCGCDDYLRDGAVERRLRRRPVRRRQEPR